ncbi:tripartite tricarboxylate transporter substrate binding protein [Ramlibacter tataouinensis]|uniref:tripartite tricarboxylate transporter substrate binding protein n=1 Tax=Ramlibacter tataouinensis TaxID=94132 RepID=UPI0022F3E57B|nr:tripartite tricarboxylate transporter substrate binding protein [Ramlibacter tataouinensis]WBY00532.1 tripartite tricarboxylate transporter substrate binding protein [Ramlibacter tataouinensis]
MISRRILLQLSALLFAAAGGAAQADYPDKPIRMIVPWAAGGSTDTTARALAKAAEAHLGQPIVVINAPGASTTIGMAQLSRAPADGYTIGTLSSTSYNFALSGQKLSYDPIQGFSYISYYGDNLIGVAVPASSPFKTLRDLVAHAKKHRLTYGTAGAATTQHLIGAGLQKATDAQIDHIPMNGSAGSINALLGKHVDFSIETSVWMPHLQSGAVRVLAVNTPERSKHLPGVPTLRELGFPYLRSVQGIIAPPNLPEPIREKLETAFRKALTDTAFVNVMDRMSMEVIDMSGKDTKALVEREFQRAQQLEREGALGSAQK